MSSPGQPDPPEKTPTPGVNLGVESLFPAKGCQSYLVVVQDRRIIEVRETQADATRKNAAGEDSPLVDRKWVARTLGCHADTVSRKRKELEAGGLVGLRLGGRKLMWRKEQVIAYAEHKGLTGRRKPGRPRKTLG